MLYSIKLLFINIGLAIARIGIDGNSRFIRLRFSFKAKVGVVSLNYLCLRLIKRSIKSRVRF